MDSIADGLFEVVHSIGAKYPKAGLILAASCSISGMAFIKIWPKGLSGFGWLFGWILLALAIVTLASAIGGFIDGASRSSRLRKQERLQDLHDLTWKEFEEVVADTYRAKGYKVREIGGPGDGGIDLMLHDPSGTTLAVQCKRWKDWRVGAPKVREFVGALAGMPDADRGIYVTCGTYTADAVSLAQRHHVELIDGDGLLKLIASVNGRSLGKSPATEAAKPIVAAKAIDDACPECGRTMVRRMAKKGANAGKEFWGCPDYPRCHGTRPV